MKNHGENLATLTDQIGFSATIQLLRAWGGRRIRIPMSMCESHPIALSIGLEAGEQLCQFYGGTEIELPAERNALVSVRNKAILKDLGGGVSVRRCGLRYGVTPRMVRYIRERQIK